jgi:HPt (histidine-containing phosphotransfer) domain-containing protein
MGQLVEVDQALEELGLEMEDFVDFLQDLKEFVAESIPLLNDAIVQSDYSAVREHSHSMKGALANLRFVEAAKIAYEIEKIGSTEENISEADAQCKALEKCIEESFTEVAAL